MKTLNKKENRKYLQEGWSKVYGRPVSNVEVDLINANAQNFLNVMERIDGFIKEQKK